MEVIWFPIPLPITASNGLLFIIELCFAYIFYPRLIHHGDYLSTLLRMRRRGYVIPGRGAMRALSGGVDFRLFPALLHLVTVLIGLALVFSLEPVKILHKLPQEARLLRRKEDLSHASSEDMKCGARQCKTLEPDSSNTYNFFVAYKDYPDRTVNTEGDKKCGSIVISCIGNRPGNTLPEKSDKFSPEHVYVVCCKNCENRTDLVLSGNFSYTANDGVLKSMKVCSTDNSTLMRTAFEQLRNHPDKRRDAYNLMNDDVLPGLMFDLTDDFQNRTYIRGESNGTAVQKFAYIIIVLGVLLGLHAFVLIFYIVFIGKLYVHHGTSDVDVRTILEAVMETEKDEDRKDGGGVKKRTFFKCHLYGCYSVIVINPRNVTEIVLRKEAPATEIDAVVRSCPICPKRPCDREILSFDDDTASWMASAGLTLAEC